MDGDGFDLNAWGSQSSTNGPAHGSAARAGLDLNSQVPVAEGFPGLGLYGSLLQDDDAALHHGRVMGSGLPPYRPPRAGGGEAPPFARQLHFGGSSSAAAGQGRGNSTVLPGGSSGAGGVVRQRANSASVAPVRRVQRQNMASRSAGHGQASRSRAPRLPRTTGRGQAPGSVGPFDNEDEVMEDNVEELASFAGHPVSHGSPAQWNDANNACLLELCIEQRRAGTYNGAQMSGEGYQAIVDGLLARRGLVYTRGQVKNQIGMLKNTHSFWRYTQTHTGLGRLPDGTIDADSDFWITHTEKKPYLKRLQFGPPGNEDLLDELFRGITVDGSIAFVPGDDYGENQGQDEGAEEEEEEFEATPTSRSNQRSQKGKRSLSTSSTLTSPVKKSKCTMVKICKDIANTFKESLTANTKEIQKRASDKAAFCVKRCQELAFER